MDAITAIIKAIFDKAFLEKLYFISGPFLVFIAYMALNHVKVAKRDLKTRVERESLLLAVSQCDLYANEIIRLVSDLIKKEKEFKIPAYNGNIEDFDFDSLTESNSEFSRKWLESIKSSNEACIAASNLANKFEALSMYFVTGLADKNIAFKPLAVNYCATIARLYPWICLSRKNGDLYKNIIALYSTWSAELKKNHLFGEIENISTQLESLEHSACRPIVGLE